VSARGLLQVALGLPKAEAETLIHTNKHLTRLDIEPTSSPPRAHLELPMGEDHKKYGLQPHISPVMGEVRPNPLHYKDLGRIHRRTRRLASSLNDPPRPHRMTPTGELAANVA
jgi:hypothetical protein